MAETASEDLQLITALLSNATVRSAAESAGVSESTVSTVGSGTPISGRS